MERETEKEADLDCDWSIRLPLTEKGPKYEILQRF